MKYGCFLPLLPAGGACHSKYPSAGSRQRRLANAALKAGFSLTVSARALISLLPIAVSLAQKGTRPQRTIRSSRCGRACCCTACCCTAGCGPACCDAVCCDAVCCDAVCCDAAWSSTCSALSALGARV